MINEIGSEFHYIECGNNNGIRLPKVKDYSFTFSGRTSIETVILNEPNIKSILLPSYCCDSMIVPFIKNGITIKYYSVNYDNGLVIDIDLNNVDAILWCNYFGFNLEMPDFSTFINNGGIIIEDITQSFYSLKQYHEQSHYLIGSLRKWEPLICGGFVGCKNKILNIKPSTSPPNEFISTKLNAMKLKDDYLNGTNISKSTFLDLFHESNSWIVNNYNQLSIDDYSLKYLNHINLDNERMIRKKNAKKLYDGLKDNKNIQFLFKEEQMDCPLFVPIIINDKRDVIRKKLIDNNIYCPVHWPKPINCQSNLYDLELSLICDQRYDEEDMMKIVSVINSIDEGKFNDKNN